MGANKVLCLCSNVRKGGSLMDLMTLLGPILLCVAAIVAAAVLYFVATFIKGRIGGRKDRRSH